MRTWSRTSSRTSVRTFDRTESGALPVVPDPYFEYTTLLLPGNGTNGAQNNTFLDSSTNAFSITRNGNTTQGTFSPFSQTGWGNYFDGNGDWLEVPTSATTFAGSNFTVECWLYYLGDGRIYANYRSDPSSVNGSELLIAGTDAYFAAYQSSTNPAVLLQVAHTMKLGTWNHIAVTRSSSTFTLWINGLSRVTASYASALNAPDGAVTYIARRNWQGNANYLTGYLSNFRVVIGTAVYTANFTPPTSPLTAITNTSLLTCQSNRFRDASTNNFTVTRNGDVSVQAFSPFNPTASWSAATYGGSGYFDGSGDYLTTPSNAAFGFGTGDFTIECWIWAASAANPALIKRVFFFSDDRNNVDMDTSGNLEYYDGTVRNLGTCPLRAWTHVAISKTSGTVSAYVNGTRTYTGAESTNTSTRTFTVGAKNTGAEPWDGYITDVRILKGQGLYSGTTITVPTAPLTAVTNTQLLLSYTNAGIYDATSKNDLETVGNAQISTTQSKFGGSSMYFDGTGDYLTRLGGAIGNFGTGDFTVEFWMYPTSPNVVSNMVDFRGTGGTGNALRIGFGNSIQGTLGKIVAGISSDIQLVPSNTTSANAWYHVAVSRSGTSMKLFVNGTTVASTTDSTSAVDNGLIIGSYKGTEAYFTGYIDDLRITKGIARYTSNFTPPTTAFPLL